MYLYGVSHLYWPFCDFNARDSWESSELIEFLKHYPKARRLRRISEMCSSFFIEGTVTKVDRRKTSFAEKQRIQEQDYPLFNSLRVSGQRRKSIDGALAREEESLREDFPSIRGEIFETLRVAYYKAKRNVNAKKSPCNYCNFMDLTTWCHQPRFTL